MKSRTMISIPTAMNKINDPRVLQGMQKQFELRQSRLNAGEKLIGWKVGFGAPAAMERLNLNAPLIGFLTDKISLASGASISCMGWTKAAAELEIAVYMGTDLPGPSDRATTKSAIASIGPAIEFADISFPPDDVESILAGNIYNRYVMLGKPDPTRTGCNLDGLIGHAYRNGQETDKTNDPQAMTGDLVNIVSSVASTLAMLGETLRAGEVIITSTIIPHLWLGQTEEIQYHLEPVDTISVFIDG